MDEKKGLTLQKFVENARAPIEHHFHNHQWCDAEWCPFKDWDDKELNHLLKEQDKIENKRCPICVDKEVESDTESDASKDTENFQTLHDIDFLSDDVDSLYKCEDEGSESSATLEFDTDDVDDFVKRGTYFEDVPDAALFEGFSADQAKAKEVEIAKKGKGHYRSMVKHSKLHDDILSQLAPFLTLEMVSQMFHTHDTNLNESLNKSAMNKAPKERTYSMSMSLTTRILIVAAVQIVGQVAFWTKVLSLLGLSMDPPLREMLEAKDKMREYKRSYSQRKENKRKRMENINEQIKQGIEDEKKAIAEGKNYSSGIAIQAEKAARKTVKEMLAARERRTKTYQ